MVSLPRTSKNAQKNILISWIHEQVHYMQYAVNVCNQKSSKSAQKKLFIYRLNECLKWIDVAAAASMALNK